MTCPRCNDRKAEGFDAERCRLAETVCPMCAGMHWTFVVDIVFKLNDIPTDALGRELFRRFGG